MSTCECGHTFDEHDDAGACTASDHTALPGSDHWNSHRRCRCFAYEAAQ